MPMTSLAALFCMLVAAGCLPVALGDSARVTLRAKWEATPLLHEAAEFLAEEDPMLFWRLAERWAPPPGGDDAQCWEAVRDAAEAELSPAMRRVFAVSMALRQYSPKLQMLRQLAAESQPASGACCWAEVGGRVVTEAAAAAAAAAAATPPTTAESEAADAAHVFPFDHVYRGKDAAQQEVNISDPGVAHAVLYAPLGAACAAPLHAALAGAADAAPGRLAYAWRPFLGGGCEAAAGPCGALGAGGPLVLPGYGVELAIKNMEYSAKDEPKKESKGEEGDEHKEQQEKQAANQEPLAPEAVARLGLLAASAVGAAPDPLAALQALAQDFPGAARDLAANGSVDPYLPDSLASLQTYLPPGAHFLLLNGLIYDLHDFNLYELLAAVRKEVRLHDMLHGAGLPPRQARGAALLRGSAAGDGEGAPRLALNSDEFIAWVNDLENDRQYAGWPTSLQMLLMPMFPGRLPQVGRNILTAIYAFDPASPAALDIGQLVAQMRAQNWPIRFGLLPVVPELAARTKTAAAAASPAGGDGDEAREASASERMGRLLALVAHAYGGDTAARFLGDLRAQMEPAGDDSKQFQFLLANAAQRVFFARWQQWAAEAGTAKARATARVPAHTAFKNAMEGTASGSEVLSFLKGAAELARSTGLAGKAKAGVLVFNGAILANDVGSWRAATMQGLQAAMRAVQEDVYHQRLSDDAEDVYEEFLALHGAVPRINSKILSLEGRGPRYMRVSGESEEYEALQLALAGPELGRPALAGLALRPLGAAPAAGAGAPPVTHLVVADPTTHLGLSLLAGALAHSSAKGRVELVLNPASDPGALSPVEQLLLAAATGGAGASEDLRQLVASVADLRQLVEKLLQLPPAELAGTTAVQLEGWLPGGGLAPALGEAAPTLAELAARHARFVRAGLRLGPRAAAVVSNGRVVEVEESDEIAPEDFALMELCAERNQYTQVSELVDSAVEAGAVDADTAADVAMAASSVLAALAPEEADPRSGHVSDTLLKWREQVNSIEVVPRAGEPAEAPLFIQAVLNPLSKAAQRLAPLLAFLRQAFDPEMQVTLNPVTKLAQLPLKTYYRYALPDLAPGPPRPATASFAGLPHDRTLTLGMDVPEPWLVEPVEAEHDLDNLVMGELAPGEAMTAEYELEALLLTGMCLDLASLQARIQSQIHPRGVQLQLGTAAQPAGVDTLVMSNLGYFQLKAAPGVWHLQLAPGRSQQLFTVASSTGATAGDAAGAVSATPGALGVPVALTSFSGKHMYLFLRKHADRLEEDVLQPADEGAGSVWGKLGTWASGRADVPAGVESGEDERIHVFTVASGHMYERLQKIMILSAIKRTRARMKFWFIKNYMSPQMKAFVPYMAWKYGFDYEFVTYKWPSWLHKQTEKQRIIWAYKILFLDVLFPLGLKKVIFCDSDQVVRADLRELWEMDLQGAPYGYTPFCNNNRDMDGFRFWKQGFWAEHLQGRPYHISALYVIDLERFRQMAAGDRLRVMYDGLSKDPNSLANLDQDLPNYAQSTVPIFSLPQEWLWCETWCGAETRPQAKTIDLCNNPLTKEPKLQSARRIIAEWPDLNREAEEFTALVGRVQAGHMTEEALLADTSAFRTYLEPMVEGSVRTTGGLPACGLEGACGADGDDDGQQQPAVTDVGEAAPHEEL